MVFASASGSSGKPKPKPQQWSSELPTYITVYVSKPVSQTVEPPIPNDIVAFVPPAPTISTSPPRPSRPAGPGVSRPQPAPSDPPADAERQEPPDERRGSSDTTQNQAPTKPDYAPDEEEESETVAVDREKAWSYEDIFLSMDAVDLSYYSSLREYDLVREVATCLRHEKLIHFFLDDPREFLKHFATYTWDEEADAAAEEFIQWYVERFRPELERQLDILTSGPAFGEVEETIEDLTFGVEEDKFKDLTVGDVEDAIKDPTFGEAEDTITRWHKDLTNDEREVVIAIDLITGETLFVRYGDEDSVTLHDEQKELVEDRYVALLHHHPKNGAASLADLDATKWLKGEFLLVSNPDGTLHRYARVGEAMIPLEPTRNPEYAAPVDPLETAAADAAYLAQTLLEMGNPPERVMEQGEATAVIEVSGSFRAYGNQWYADERRENIKTFMNYDFTDNPQTFRVLGRSSFNPSLVQIEVRYPALYQVYHQWVNIEDLDGDFRILEGSLETLPFRYERQSIVADKKLDIELTRYPDWADRANKGVLSRDINPRGWPPPFEVQSPVIGPDVRVEYVITEDQAHKGLGNTVIISFPASIFQEDEMLMQRLANDPDHDPTKWRKDARVFYSFAHLYHIPAHITQGSRIDSRDKAIIGTTGNTGLINPKTERLYEDEHTNRHLDLIIVLFGSIDDTLGQMEQALGILRPYEGTVDAFFGFAERSNLYLPDGHALLSLYGENIDPVRVEPEHDEDERAQDENFRSIYPPR